MKKTLFAFALVASFASYAQAAAPISGRICADGKGGFFKVAANDDMKCMNSICGELVSPNLSAQYELGDEPTSEGEKIAISQAEIDLRRVMPANDEDARMEGLVTTGEAPKSWATMKVVPKGQPNAGIATCVDVVSVTDDAMAALTERASQ